MDGVHLFFVGVVHTYTIKLLNLASAHKSSSMNSLFNKKAIIIAILCIVTFICFSYTRHNQFTNWDDDYYVTNDPYIKALTAENLKVIFTEDITKNNYHPLCMLSLAFNYYFSGLNPAPYYLTNVAIHIANVVLVFFLFLGLCSLLKVSDKGKLFIAGFGALWFGIHPMHVESVAWIAERKDVLYAFFYVLGLLAYLRFIKEDNKKWYWLTLLAFIASCLSKPMAVVFPMSLLCIDVLAKRKFGQKLVVEKIIFFAISLICGGFAFYTQNKTGAVASFSALTLQERFMYASYGFIMYISKLFNPTYLSTFYPYPYRFTSGYLPSIFYLAPFMAIAFVTLPIYITWKKYREYFPVVAFGIGFFVVNVMFVLQFISVGAAIMSDRYSYVAYIGLLFLAAFLLNELIKKSETLKMPVFATLLAASGALAFLCYERTFVWHDSETLLSDAIAKYPYRALLSYKWLGHYYFDKGELGKAMENYNVLVTLHVNDKKVDAKIAQINLLKSGNAAGTMPVSTGNQPVDPQYQSHLDSSLLYTRTGDSINAFKQYIKALRFNTGIEKTYAETAFKSVQAGQYDPAILQYNVLLKINTSNPYYYFYRGVAQFSKNKINRAIEDWEIAVKLPSKDIQQSASYNLSVAYDSVGNAAAAYRYVQMAKTVGYSVKDEFVEKLKKKAGK